MIFNQITSLLQEYQTRKGNMEGYVRFTEKAPTDHQNELASAARRQVLVNTGCLPIADAAEKNKFDVAEYRDLAKQKKALLFVTDKGEEFVPLWSFDEKGKINSVAVEVGKIYVHRNAEPCAIKFCRFVTEKAVILDTERMFTEGADPKPLSFDFDKRAYEAHVSEREVSGALRSLRRAITMAVGANKEYVEQAIYARTHDLFGQNGQSLEQHLTNVRKTRHPGLRNT